MSKLFTLVLGMTLIALTHRAQAQFFQNFENSGTYANNCWSFEGYFATYVSDEVINGRTSLYSNPPTNNNGDGTRDIHTPYLAISNTTFSVNFLYKLSSKLGGKSERIISLGLVNTAGAYTWLDALTLNGDLQNPTGVRTYNKTFTLRTTGTYRFVIRVAGDNGDGNSRFIMDDLSLSATPLYNTNGNHCNSAPVAAADNYFGPAGAPLTNGSVLANDSDPNGESIVAVLVAGSPDGTVSLQPNGNFTFTPFAGFTGLSTTFTYQVRDNGAAPLLSNIATVTLHFAAGGVMPVKLVSFQGQTKDGSNQLQWLVANNKTAAQFEVERSTNGVDYTTAALLFSSEQQGDEQYRFAEKQQGTQAIYYRLKMWDRDGQSEYSQVIKLYTEQKNTSLPLALWQNGSTGIGLRFSTSATQKGNLLVTDLAGRVISRQSIQCYHGSNLANVQLTHSLGRGVYLVQLQAGGSTHTGKLLIP